MCFYVFCIGFVLAERTNRLPVEQLLRGVYLQNCDDWVSWNTCFVTTSAAAATCGTDKSCTCAKGFVTLSPTVFTCGTDEQVVWSLWVV